MYSDDFWEQIEEYAAGCVAVCVPCTTATCPLSRIFSLACVQRAISVRRPVIYPLTSVVRIVTSSSYTAKMTQYFTQQQIDEYRQCFYLYCQDGFAESASQLRYVMRSLGYSPTVPETVKYFNDHNKKVDFASFLEILHADSEKGDPMVEIIAALRGIDPKNQGWITVPEFVSILSSVGERISREEIDNILLQLDLKSSSRVPYAKLIQSLSSTPMPYHQKKK
uniref:Calmodulin-like protein 4 n=1 Tax=Ascaris suum TaxID=6253 RepID=F1L7U2_ASCSU